MENRQIEPLIQTIDLCKAYSHIGAAQTVLNKISITVNKGEFIMIMGASGSGKTTLLNLIGCLDHPTSGSYIFDGRPVESLSDKELSRLRGREIGFIFQSFNLLPRFPAWRNVELPLVYQRILPHIRRQSVQKVLDQVGLNGKSHRKPSELSGGEQQRVAIARALSVNPSLLLADEPTGNLDSQTGAEIMKIIKGLHESGMTIVMVTHAPALVSFADRVIFLKDGRISEETVQDTDG